MPYPFIYQFGKKYQPIIYISSLSILYNIRLTIEFRSEIKGTGIVSHFYFYKCVSDMLQNKLQKVRWKSSINIDLRKWVFSCLSSAGLMCTSSSSFFSCFWGSRWSRNIRLLLTYSTKEMHIGVESFFFFFFSRIILKNI